MEKSLYDKIVQIQTGDKEELLEIIEKFNPLIKKLKRKLNYEEAESDLIISLIEILLKFKLDNFTKDNDGAIVKFIYNSIRNRSIDLFRKFVLNKKEEFELNLDIVDYKSDDNLDNKIFLDDILKKLSKRQKFIIREKYFKFNTDIEISKILNISRQAVNKSKNEAFKILKKHINNCVI